MTCGLLPAQPTMPDCFWCPDEMALVEGRLVCKGCAWSAPADYRHTFDTVIRTERTLP